MKRPIRVTLFALAAALLTAPLLSQAQEAAAQAPAAPAAPAESALRVVEAVNTTEPVVSMSFDETPLTDVIKAFRDATGANIISSGTNLQSIVVSIRLEKVPWRKGLSSILDPQGLQLVEQPAGSGIYVVGTKTVEIPKLTKTFDLAFAKASDITNLLTRTFGAGAVMSAAYSPANVVVITATEQQLGECEKILKAVDKPRPQVYIEARFVELSAGASKKLGMKWDSLGKDEGWGVNVSSIKAGMEYNDGKINPLKLPAQTVGEGLQVFPGTGVVGSDGQFIEPVYQKTALNSYLVPDEIGPPSDSGRSASSMAWRHARGAGGQLSSDAFRLALNAFEQIDGASVFSNPKIIVANEETALVDMTTKEPNVSVKSTRSGTSSDQLDVTAELTKIPGIKEPFVGEAFYSYGITLKVVPRVSPTGQITVEIEPSISDKIGTYEIAGLGEGTPVASYPIINMRRIQTVFSMQSGMTAVIGGLTKTAEENMDNGIPWLRKLPWVGPRIFGWKGREKVQKEIIIFVTVGIADPLTLAEDIGMPKNAVLGRGLFTGEVKEPGDRTKDELLRLDDQDKNGNEPKEVTEREAAEEPQPAPEPAAANK